MQNVPSYFNLFIRLVLSVLGLFSIVLFPILFGVLDSYSSYYKFSPILFTSLFSTLAIGLFIHSNVEWKYPAIMLILLSVFNMYDHPLIHYSAAILFFISSTYSMWNDKRVSGFGKVSILLYPVFFMDLLIFEMFQIFLICMFHLMYILRIIKIKNTK